MLRKLLETMFNLFKRKTADTEFDFNLPTMNQDGPYDCRYEVFRSLDKYYNGSTRSVSELRQKFPNVEKSDSMMSKMYSSRSLSLSDITDTVISFPTEHDKAEFLITLMESNKAITAELPIHSNGHDYLHNVGIKTIKVFSNGKVTIKVMNPSGEGGSKFNSFKDFTRFISVTKF